MLKPHINVSAGGDFCSPFFSNFSETPCVHFSNYFWGVAESEDFACATLPTTPLIFKAKFKIFVTLPEEGQSQNYGDSINFNGLLTLSGLLSLKFLLHIITFFIKENHFNNCI